MGKFEIVTIDFTMHFEVWLARVIDGGAGFRIISDVGEIAGEWGNSCMCEWEILMLNDSRY